MWEKIINWLTRQALPYWISMNQEWHDTNIRSLLRQFQKHDLTVRSLAIGRKSNGRSDVTVFAAKRGSGKRGRLKTQRTWVIHNISSEDVAVIEALPHESLEPLKG